MSESRTATVAEFEDEDQRILLLVSGERDRELLADRLGDRHEVLVGEPDGGLAEFDLCIVDARTYRRVETDLAERKDLADAYLPVLLLVPDRAGTREAEWIGEELGGTVDDVLVVPSPKHELDARVEALLRTRRQSRKLALFRRAMDEATLGITITDADRPDNPIVYANDWFCRLTGYDHEDALGRNCRFLQGPDTDAETVAEIRAAIDAQEPVTVELLNYTADGEPFWNLLTIAPVRDESGAVTHYLGFQRDVTDRVEAVESLRQEREVIETVFDTSPVGIMVVDADGNFVRANATAEAVLGLQRAEITSRTVSEPDWDIVDVDGEPIPDEKVPAARTLATGEPVSNYRMGVTVDGERLWLSVNTAPLFDQDGLVDGVVASVQDITERLERTRDLERASLVLETMDDGVWAIDEDRRLSFVNETIIEYLPFDEADLLGTPLQNFEYLFENEAEYDRYMTAIDDLLAGRRADATVDATLSMPGETMVTNLRLAPIQADDGVDGVVVVAGDITDRVELEADLRSERELLERIFDTSLSGIVVVDGDGDIVRANPAAEAELGLERSAIEDRTYDDPEWEAFDEHGDPIPGEELPVARVLRTGEPVEDFRHGIRVDGEKRWLSINAAPLTDEHGTVEAVVTGVTDITERLERKRDLERYEAIVETTSDPIYVLDQDGHFTRVNDAMVEASGYSREELLGAHASLVGDEETVAETERYIRELLQGDRERAQFESTMVFRDGIRREFAASLAVLTDDTGEFIGSVVVAHDITDLHRSQRRLSVLDRVLRHNLRNRMNIILGYARELAAHPDEDVATLGDAIVDSGDNLLELSESARQFEAVIAGGAQPSRTIDAVELVADVVDEATSEHPDATLSVDLPDTAPIRVHETFRLAVDELLENAIEHNDTHSPTVTVAVRVVDDHVEICVADDGPGISALDQRALDAGTESPLEHTQGIGLWLVQWTVDNVDGEIDIADNEPRGTVVTITVPRAAD